MERLQYIRPTKEYEQKAIEFINEFREYNSAIEGVNGLHRYLNNYDEWLTKIEVERTQIADGKKVPTETYFLIRESDDKIIGMSTLRLGINDKLRQFGGNIGYCIRPTERKKGYNKANLYLALLVFNNNLIDNIMVDCDKTNLGSSNTIKALGGQLIKEEYFKDFECIKQDYIINVKQSIDYYSHQYENCSILENSKERSKR